MQCLSWLCKGREEAHDDCRSNLMSLDHNNQPIQLFATLYSKLNTVHRYTKRPLWNTHSSINYPVLFTFVLSQPKGNSAYLNLMIIAFKGFHDHQDSFKLSIKPAILTVEPIHASRHVTEKFEQLWLLLRASKLHITQSHTCKLWLLHTRT